MRKCMLLVLYCAAFTGIAINIFFQMKWIGIVGYASLIIAGMLEIASSVSKLVRRKKKKQ